VLGRKKNVFDVRAGTFLCAAAHFFEKVMTSSPKKNVRKEKKMCGYSRKFGWKSVEKRKKCVKSVKCAHFLSARKAPKPRENSIL